MSELNQALLEKIEQLKAKYAVMGQDILSYMDGLLHADYLTYWDYIRLDVLLNLQAPRTPFPDESIFILYHQITELHFKLILHAQVQLRSAQQLDAQMFLKQVHRMDRYFELLIHSFDIMTDGMDPAQFMQFRMALLPASGFQSAQYRLIEIGSTDFFRLTSADVRDQFHLDSPLEEVYQHLYWKRGATELATGEKTLTLKQFEQKYRQQFIDTAAICRSQNLYALYRNLPAQEQDNPELIKYLKAFDKKANVEWPLMHLKAASRYLRKDPIDIKATGGTNWQQYLPPKNRLVCFFPELHSSEDLKQWGLR